MKDSSGSTRRSVRQIGLGVSKLTHKNAVQMSLFEDPKMDFYREWDRKYDEEKSQNEDAKTLAYERTNETTMTHIAQ